MKQVRDLRIDLVRTHDFFGPTDIDAQWPDPDAICAGRCGRTAPATSFPTGIATQQEESYNLGPSDRMIRGTVEAASGADMAGFAVRSRAVGGPVAVQVLIGNYEDPGGIPQVASNERRYREADAAHRQYKDSGGYALKVSHLPWGAGTFRLKRHRITKTDNWTELEGAAKDGTREMSNSPPPRIELIVIRSQRGRTPHIPTTPELILDVPWVRMRVRGGAVW